MESGRGGGGGEGSNNPWNRNGNILAVSEQFQTEKEFQNKVFLPKLHPWKRGKKSVVVWGWRFGEWFKGTTGSTWVECFC